MKLLASVFALVLVFEGLFLLISKVGVRKTERYKQVFMPVVAAIYGMIGILFILFFEKKIDEIVLDNIPEAKYVFLNCVLAIFFCIIKFVFSRLLGNVLMKDNEAIEEYVGKYYCWDVEFQKWFLEDKWLTVRSIFYWSRVAALSVGSTILMLGMIQGISSTFYMAILPVILALVLAEIYDFLNGYTKEEYLHIVNGEDVTSMKICNFFKIREVFEKMFAHELLISSTEFSYESKQGVLPIIEKLRNSDDPIEKITADFFDLNVSKDEYDADGIDGSLKLMKGENVIFFNPFYRDLGKYIILPLVNTLLSAKKCLIIVSRNSTKEDIISWLNDIILEYAKVDSLWKIKELTDTEPQCDIGILSLSQLYDREIIEANRKFFSATKFVFMSEPSLMVNIGQVGLSIVAEYMQSLGEKPIYCISDRSTDGFVDTISHLLQAEFTEVIAPSVSKHIRTAMAWNADGDYLRQKLFEKQPSYLGNGIELASVAIKNQVPKVSWYSESKVPIRDIKWIAGQYYSSLCKYMNIPVQQKGLYDKIDFVANIWSVSKDKQQFIIAEDEFCNMFGAMRTYLSRGNEQTFVNVLSENYLLRDYMRCNQEMMRSNPNAIPSMVPDYAKTERNVLNKLLMLMASQKIGEAYVLKEMILLGYETDNAYHALINLLRKYSYADSNVITISSSGRIGDEIDFESEQMFSIEKSVFDENFGTSLKNAYYIVEDEKKEKDYIDAKLFGHVTQTVLPDQFVTYDGKYYQVKHISPDSGVVLRRASDQFESRKYYRQIREYSFREDESDEIVRIKNIMDIEIAVLCKCFEVKTTGYLEMQTNNDLRNARVIDFSNDTSVKNFYRSYRNKDVLRIKLPDTNDKIRFTICMLLSEVLKSVFPNAWQYIAVVTTQPENIEGMLNYMVYQITGNFEDEYIYIIEDSEIDLGILGAIEKNFIKFMEIVEDFIDWHFEKMREPAYVEPALKDVELPEEKHRRSLVTSMFSRINKLFGGKKEENIELEKLEKVELEDPKESKQVKTEDPVEKAFDFSDSSEAAEMCTNDSGMEKEECDDGNEPYDLSEAIEESIGEVAATTELKDASSVEIPEDIEIEKQYNPEIIVTDGTDIFENETLSGDEEYLEECFERIGIVSLEKSRYQKECYLNFGFNEIDSRIKLEEVSKYFYGRGWGNNSLKLARTRNRVNDTVIDLKAVNHCDFCGLPLSGVCYERIADGRIRCNECGTTAMNEVRDYKKLFYQVIETMKSYYNIQFNFDIFLKVTDAKTIAKGYGCIFTPSTESVDRVVGFAQKRFGRYSMFLENGSPRLAAIDTMVHELTHIWQYKNWNENEIEKLYGNGRNRDIVYEGMAVWTAIQYLYFIGEVAYARQQELLAESRTDVYGEGFKIYRDRFSIKRDSSVLAFSPFGVFPPL